VQDFASTFRTDAAYMPGPYLRASGLAGAGAIPQNPALRESIPKRMAARLVAWDPVTQQERWRVPYDFAGNGGVLTTAGNLVFQGTSAGEFVAYDAEHIRSFLVSEANYIYGLQRDAKRTP
jgi:hypothetical protein